MRQRLLTIGVLLCDVHCVSNSSNSSLALVDPEDEAAIQAGLADLAQPGSYFDGLERLAIAAQTRAARGLTAERPSLDPVLGDAAARIATDAITTRPEHIGDWQAAGQDILAYVELVAVVALITSIDSYRIGVGADLDPLPEPQPGPAVRAVAEGAQIMNAWVPTVGIALAPTALSALPNEKATKDRLGSTWYLSDEFIHKYDVEPGRELTRSQMELVASRTSWLNECFF